MSKDRDQLLGEREKKKKKKERVTGQAAWVAIAIL
jgi:hypothetical protein